MECTWDAALLDRVGELPDELLDVIRHADNQQYLQTFTRAALEPRYTSVLFSHAEPLFPHILAQTSTSKANPAIIVAFLGRVVPHAPYLAHYAERFIQCQTQDIDVATADDLDHLLGLYRLLAFDVRTFRRYVDAKVMHSLLSAPSLPVRYMAIRILQLLLCIADHSYDLMVTKYIGKEQTIIGAWKDTVNHSEDQTIDYRFLTLWEEWRAECLLKEMGDARTAREAQIDKQSLRWLKETDFDESAALVGGVLLSPEGDRTFATFQPSLVPTSTVQNNLHNIASALKSEQPLLLTGPAGSGKSLLLRHVACRLNKLSTMVTLHLNEQSDAKLLTGLYSTGPTPGTFVWKPGVLTTAVQEGRWVFIEDLDRAPNEIVSTLLPLIERRELVVPSRGQTFHAASGFRIIGTVRSQLSMKGEESRPLDNIIGRRHWQDVQISMPALEELRDIAAALYPSLTGHMAQFTSVYRSLLELRQRLSASSLSRTGLLRPLSPRDLLRWCHRVSGLLSNKQSFTSTELDDIFLEAIDCFCGFLPSGSARQSMTDIVARELQIDPQRRDYLLYDREITYQLEKTKIKVGRYQLPRAEQQSRRPGSKQSTFSANPHTTRMLERTAAAICNREPLLLVGETGVGKTTAVQHISQQIGQKLEVYNLSQHSESGDLLGGFKPVNTRSIMVPLKDEFDELFSMSFSAKRNASFVETLGKASAKSNWKIVLKLWRQALQMVEQHRSQPPQPKKRKVEISRNFDFAAWDIFAAKINDLEKRLSSGSEAFAFSFVEGNIVSAIREGHWILLDEINLASPDTLECLADLLDPSPSILLTEAGNIERIHAHPDFRVFAAMNPATDVGKKDLPAGIRSRFTELFVESPDKDSKSLQSIVRAYLGGEMATDPKSALDVSNLYQAIVSLAEQNRLVDGSGQRPHFSLRSLTRCLSYARYIATLCSLRRALYEGFQMSFLTLLDLESEKLVRPMLEKHLLSNQKNTKSVLAKPVREPKDGKEYIREGAHWVRKGALEVEQQPYYIKTPFIEKNLSNLIRAISTRQSPVLIQGPTSSGKTSMIEYLARRTGNKFVRINNHEHTDLQEYLGTYTSGADGKLMFQEGVLVKALREGSWVVLDELNLAPTDVLEALNRLLDDNRELLIPETQETVKPHENFTLFATQNPAGLYGGRKTLSRAFRNRFLELHFDDIPVDELHEILERRTQLPGSWCRRIVTVYKELSALRSEERLFEQKSFATLRDLFRWAMRPADTVNQLAANGFMLLAERVRKQDERQAVKQVIERVMSEKGPKVLIEEAALYSSDAPAVRQHHANAISQSTVWTKAMRRLYILVAQAIANNEPVLLIGDTGCGKTTVCQMLADAAQNDLHIVNAHQNTETSDLIGSQRPLRNRTTIEAQLIAELMQSPVLPSIPDSATDELLVAYDQAYALLGSQQKSLVSAQHGKIQDLRTRYRALFEWADGSLVHAMKSGSFFVLDEISLADDSVLERINSVLESGRSLLLAEKGSLDSSVTATAGFQFLATMNPGGDYGKRELSPALRNRFTEIWVPNLSDSKDVLQIVQAKLTPEASQYGQAIVQFAYWFNARYNTLASSNISIRDTLAWIEFINTSHDLLMPERVAHGAAMVYIDTLGANPAGLLSINVRQLDDERKICFSELSGLIVADAASICLGSVNILSTDNSIMAGPFALPRNSNADPAAGTFNFKPSTTRFNTMRIFRALQLTKPILLEGNPGVGKTTLITAIAKSVGMPLTRINLSEQTDLMDIFGSDVPISGAEAGVFAWHEAPFLKAMKNGEWVLLDEMNLASQSVLEGLNACLDHRGEIYVSELNLTFKRHPNFRLFAAQNPHHQGGGRKGLPASFVNRFTVVYADVFKAEDLFMICHQLFPAMPPEELEKAIRFVDCLEAAVQHTPGGPWEINLRDTTRWLSLITAEEGLLRSGRAHDFFDLVFAQRFRTSSDRSLVRDLFRDVFYDSPRVESSLFHNVSSRTLQIGLGLLPRHPSFTCSFGAVPAMPDCRPHLRAWESLMVCIQCNWPVILAGSSGAGKTRLIEATAGLVGAELVTFSMNADIDAADLVGGYEQSDTQREFLHVLACVRQYLQRQAALHLSALQDQQRLPILLDGLNACEASDLSNNSSMFEVMSALHTCNDPEAEQLLKELEAAAQKGIAVDRGQFDWIDGVLVDALQQGQWLVLDNANLCSPSVLDRLNSLLEPSGALIINEHSTDTGEARIITPHPDFRIFLLENPRYGELSRAMRNRAVEIYVPAEASLSTTGPSLHNESSTYRLRQARILSSATAKGDVDPKLLSRFAYDHTGIGDQAIVRNFEAQLEKGLYKTTHATPSLVEKTEQLTQQPPQYGHSMILDFYNLKTQQMQVTADFVGAQTMHPLINPPLFSFSESNVQYALNVASVYDTLRQAAAMQRQLDYIQQHSLGSTNLSRLQRSASIARIPNAQKDSTSGVYGFLDQVVRTMVAWAQQASGKVRQGRHDTEAKYLRQLSVYWSMLYDMVHEQSFEEALFQAYLSVGRAVLNRSTSPDTTLPSISASLDDAIDMLGRPNRLTTGLAMSSMWSALKPPVPKHVQQLQDLLAFEAFLDHFDAARPATMVQVEKVVAIRLLLRQALHQITVENADARSLTETLSGMVNNTEQPQEGQAQIQPFFQDEFESLCQLLTFPSAQLYSSFNSSLFATLELLAGRKTTIARLQSRQDPAHHSVTEHFKSLESYLGQSQGSEQGGDQMEGLVRKLKSVGDVPLQQVDLLQTELEKLGRVVGSYSHQLCADELIMLDGALMQLLLNVLQALTTYPGQLAVCDWAAAATKQLLTVHESPKTSSEHTSVTLREKLTAASLPGLGTLCNSISYLLTAFSTKLDKTVAASQAWTSFALACVQLYVPDKSFDPALSPMVERQLFRAESDRLANDINALRVFQRSFTGQSASLAIILLEHDLGDLGPEPKVSEVVRPQKSQLRELLGEFSAITRLLTALATHLPVDDHTFWQNLMQIRHRLKKNYRAYDDVISPIVGFVDCLCVGHRLDFHAQLLSQQQADLSQTSQDLVPLLRAHPENWFNENTLLRLLSTQSSATLTIFNLSALAMRSAVQPINDASEQLQQSVDYNFSSFYEQWKAELGQGQRETAAKSSLYRYRGDAEAENEDSTEEYEELFPNYENQDLESTSATKGKHDRIQNLAVDIARIHGDVFSPKTLDCDSLMELLARSSEVLAADRAHHIASDRLVPLLLVIIARQQKILSFDGKPSSAYNIYTDPNVEQARKLLSLVQKVESRFRGIQEAWPDHATPSEIIRTCFEIMAFPHTEPVAKLLTKTEKLHEYILEWQKVASREYSAAGLYEELTDLIVSWRQLELTTWSRLFDLETQRCDDDAMSWWFVAYENIIAVSETLESSEPEMQHHATGLLKTLETFFMNTGLGQYSPRLRLLRNFKADLAVRVSRTSSLQVVHDSMTNFIAYFSCFEAPVNEALAHGRKALEKDIQNVIQMASWRDRTIDALRQSAKSSHRKLFKLVRKYRALLGRSVSSIISAGVPDASNILDDPDEASISAVQSISNGPIGLPDLPTVSAWQDRPDRFLHISATTRIMLTKTSNLNINIANSNELQAFASELKSAITSLQKATPATQTKKNVEAIKHLKTRKRRLFADTLKAVRNMGFRSSLSGEALERQGSLQNVLSTLATLETRISVPGIKQAENSLHQLLSIMPEVREAARKHSEDLTAAEVARCIAYLESMLQLAIKQRQLLHTHASIAASLSSLSSQTGNLRSIVVEKTGRFAESQMQGYESLLPYLAPLTEAVAQITKIQSSLAGIDYTLTVRELSRMAELLSSMQQRASHLPNMPSGVESEQHVLLGQEVSALVDELRQILEQSCQRHPELTCTLDQLHLWTNLSSVDGRSTARANGIVDTSLGSWTGTTLNLVDGILGSIQDLDNHLATANESSADGAWVLQQQKMMGSALENLHGSQIRQHFEKVLSQVQSLVGQDPAAATAISTIVGTLQPVKNTYVSIYHRALNLQVTFHDRLCSTTYHLAKSFTQLARDGFCSPSERPRGDDSKAEQAESGTGLGEGEGAEDISKDIKDDEDLSELAQEPNKKEDQEEIEDEKDAVDMADEEMEGELGDVPDKEEDGDDASGDEADEDEMEEQAGDVDDLGPSAVDEKMWDDGSKDAEKNKEADNADGTADEDETAASGDKKDSDSSDRDELAAGEEVEEDTGADETEEVVHAEEEKLDPHAQDQEKLDLPDDMNMDGKPDQGEESDLESFGEDDKQQASEDTPMDMEDGPASPTNEEDVMGDDKSQEMEEDVAMENDDGSPTNEAGQEDIDNDVDDDTGLLQDKRDDDAHAAEDVAQQTELGIGMNQADKMDDQQASNAAAAQDEGIEGEKVQDKQPANAQGQSGRQQGEEVGGADEPDQEERSLPYKKLGDALEEWYKQQRQIRNASKPDEETQDRPQDADMADTEFEHVPDDEAAADTQALGAASMDESHALDADAGLPVNEQETAESFLPDEMDVDEEQDAKEVEKEAGKAADPANSQPFQERPKAFIGEDNNTPMDLNGEDAEQQDKEEDVQNMDQQLTDTHLVSNNESDHLTESEARAVWQQHESSTRNLALLLTEHLRLILHPTQATKMRGDYRTGKRLNIKRIIPYIASSYKRDKIWMRRAVPSKRSYQVMLAIDDSKSMAESESKDLAFETLALVAKALAMLEVGELCVVGFGEGVQVMHDFSAPFTSEAGAQVFQQFDFAQTRTNVRRLVADSIGLFRDARLKATSSASELWQLQLIISDGMCEDHASIRQLVRQAHDERIMIVFVVIDAAAMKAQTAQTQPTAASSQGQSITDLRTAVFERDEGTGELRPKMGKYLDTFPFRYYIVVRDVAELPGVLAGALRQWFAEVVETGGY